GVDSSSAMYIEAVPNRNSPPAILLRETYRQGGKFRKRTLCNLVYPISAKEGLGQRGGDPAGPGAESPWRPRGQPAGEQGASAPIFTTRTVARSARPDSKAGIRRWHRE